MKHVIAINFSEQPYYVRINQNTWDEIYNPELATVFSDKKEAELWAKSNTNLDEYMSVDLFSDAVQKWNDWKTNGYVRRSFPLFDKAINIRYDAKIHTLEDVIKQQITFNQNGNSVHDEVRHSWPELFMISDCMHGINFYMDGNYSIEMKINKAASFDQFKKDLDIALKYTTVVDEEFKVISIFDYRCGEGGQFYYFHYKDNKNCSICSKWSTIIKGDLNTVFEHWKKHYFYHY